MRQAAKRLFLLLTAIFFAVFCHAQTPDTLDRPELGYADTVAPKVRSVNAIPRKAALYSALLPGTGQVMNDQWWKVPVIYAGFAATGYFALYWDKEYKRYRDAYRIRVDGDSGTIDQYDPFYVSTGERYSNQGLARVRDESRRNRDLLYIVGGLVYFANILDAYVYAHLKDFDVGDNLSMRFSTPRPMMLPNGMTGVGVSLQLKLK